MNERNVESSHAQIKLIFDSGDSNEFPLERLIEELGLEMNALATSAGVLVMEAIMKSEIEHLAGIKHTHGTIINRHGSQTGSLVVGGQRVRTKKPRLRAPGVGEVPLKSYVRFHNHDERTQAVFERLVAGVSCRKYRQTVETVAKTSGISRSVVSREMIQATSGKLKALCERDLSGLDIRVIVIDGFVLAKQMVVAALGVESSGKKHILGFLEGATENARVCIDLLQDLQARKLRMNRPILVIIDGSRALRAAVDQFFGSNAIVQRCQQHKRENLKKYLPEDHQAAHDRKLQAIYGMTSYDDAKRSLIALIRDVGRISISAANSLEEGFEETLTVHRLGLPDVLRQSFSTTNLIESAFSVARTVMHNIKRWRTPMQRSRWVSTALLQAEKQFRCVRGFKSMSVLVAALDANEPQTNNTMTAA